MIGIVNYGLGNLTSISNMFKKLGIDALISDDIVVLKKSEKLILPGVGHFKKGMENLKSSGLVDMLNHFVLIQQKPILGICLGAQLMTQHSEEGDVAGLGWIDATTVRFDSSKLDNLKIPHMGWSDIQIVDENPLWKDLPPTPRFYHVHSYHFKMSSIKQVSANALYGYEFTCAFRKNNIYGAQFHPEKSHKYGMKILENFSNL